MNRTVRNFLLLGGTGLLVVATVIVAPPPTGPGPGPTPTTTSTTTVTAGPGGLVIDGGADCTSPYNDEPNHAGSLQWLPVINAYRTQNNVPQLVEDATSTASIDAYNQLLDMQTYNYFSTVDRQGQTIATRLAAAFPAPAYTFSGATVIFVKGCYGGNTVSEILTALEGIPAANAILLNPNYNKFGAAMVASSTAGSALSRWGLVFVQVTP